MNAMNGRANAAMVAIAVSLGVACDRREPALFGKACVDDSECAGDEGWVCDPFRHQCAAPRPPEEIPGLTCDDAHDLVLRDAGGLFVGNIDVELPPLAQNSAAPEGAACVGDARFVYARVVVPTAMAARVRADGQGKVTIAVANETCGTSFDHACTATNELVVPLLSEGTFTVVASASAGERIEIEVEQIECPAGFVPTAEDRCLGFLDLEGPTPRVGHELTVVDEDNVAVTGGIGADGHVASQLFSRRALRWGELFDVVPRDGHAAAATEGFLFVVGGGELAGEILDPGESQFFAQSEPFEAVGVREGTLTRLSSEEPMLFVGGEIPVSAFFFKPSENCDDGFDCPASFECVAVLEDFTIGEDGRCLCVAEDCNRLIREVPSWQSHNAASELSFRQRHLAMDIDERPEDALILVTGGVTNGSTPSAAPPSFVLFGESLTWVQIPTEPAPRRDAVGAAIGRGDVVLVGGRDESEEPSALIELWTPLIPIAPRTSQMARARADLVGALLDDTTFIAIGGDDGNGPLATTELIDVSSGDVRVGPTLPFPLREARAVVLDDGSLLVAGGRTTDGALVDTALLLTQIAPTTVKPEVGEGFALPDADGDFCEDAIVLADASGAVEGNTIGFEDDIDVQQDAGCNGVIRSPGFDVFFTIDVPAGATLDLVLVDPISASDLVLVVYDECPLVFPCIDGADIEVEEPEVLTVTAPADPGGASKTFLIVVDAFGFDVPFNYRLEWTVTPP